MRQDFVGSFYFKQTITGNLIGEFINNDSFDVHVESAKRVNDQQLFEGTYDSTWFDETLHLATLTISRVGNKFNLEWNDSKSIHYEGQGFIVDSMLIGYYRRKS